MTSLAEIQALFRDAIFEKAGERKALKTLTQLVNATPGLSATEHVRIYRQAVIGTLQRALENIYPVCLRLVGEEFFGGMAREYAHHYPSHSPDLGEYGDEFATFISAFEPARELPYLPDVARLEWCWHRAFNAPDESPLDPAKIGDVPQTDIARIVFRLAASASLLQSCYPVQKIWQVNQSDWTGDQDVDLGEAGSNLIIWRKDYEIRIDDIDDEYWSFLNAIQRGAAMSELAEISALDRMLPASVQKGWIGGFRIAPEI